MKTFAITERIKYKEEIYHVEENLAKKKGKRQKTNICREGTRPRGSSL